MPVHAREYLAPWSVYKAKLADDAPIASTSANFAGRLFRQARYTQSSTPIAGNYSPPYLININTEGYSFPTYTVPEDQPRVRVVLKINGVTPMGYSIADGLQYHFDEVPLPFLEDCKPGRNPWGAQHQIESNGTDQSVAIICGNEMWEFWKFQPDTDDPSGKTFQCTWGGYTPNIKMSNGIYRNYWGARAAGTLSQVGLIKVEDLLENEIKHALAISMPVTGGASWQGDGFVPPIYRHDTFSRASGDANLIDADRIPEGIRFRLPANFDIDAYIATISDSRANKAVIKLVSRAFRDYGLTVLDSSPTISFYAEEPRAMGTPYHEHAGWPTNLDIPAPTTGLWNWALHYLPWAHMQQLAPVTVLNAKGIVRVNGQLRKLRQL